MDGPTALEFLKRAGMSIVLLKAKDTTGPTPGIVIKRRHTSSSRTTESSLRWSFVNISRSFCRAANNGSMISTKFGHASDKLSDSFFEFAHSNGADLETEVAQQPADIILDGDGLFLQNFLRAVSRARRFWLVNVFTCTARNKLTRIICAMPRASLLLPLFT